ncbi:hypothetical protein WJX72_002472 [[Myrmecia] bisecta]|uniref:Undecaprenyldiphospho-muramoylpentapeptide beta-N-acetylglucosaminyltransferase n=1 Tax=[Myrmecia] bisecta TaxID=41462 RepID=A0AAW1QA34_9CHLO
MLPLRPPVQVSFIGTQERLEHRAVAAAGFEFHALTAPSLRRPLLSWQNLLLPGRLLWSLVQAWRLLRRMRPDVVVGTGGYISFPTCLAAALQGRPLVIQEQNAAPGIANRILARFATLVFIAFQAASSRLPHCKGHLTGNPMRAGLGMLSQAAARAQLGLPDGDYPVLCILGGSLGAAALNKAVAANLSELLGLDPGLHVIWQTGERYLQAVTGSVDTHHRLKLVPFIHSMAAVYAAADLVVSRAGAITCSELLVTATPALLVPSPNVAEDHQTQNALAMEATGAASCLSEASLAADLLPCVASLLKDPMRLTAMRQAALLAGQSNAASIIAEAVVDIASRRHPCKWQSTAVSQR